MTTAEIPAGGPHVPLENQVNRSGFPFQLAVEQEIRKIPTPYDWRIVGTEIPCGPESYVDIVARHEHLVAIIECKQANDQTWVFLVPEAGTEGLPYSLNNLPGCRVETFSADPKIAIFGGTLAAEDLSVADGSYISEICTLSQGKISGQTLEAVCQVLVKQTQALAGMTLIKRSHDVEVFLPIVVTNAALHVCTYDPTQLTPVPGEIPPGSTYTQVDLVRFSKTLTEGEEVRLRGPVTLEDLVRLAKRTVFVCRSTYLRTFLSRVSK